MDEMERQDDALFEALRKSKKRKKRRRIITVFLILCLLIAGVATGVIFLRRRVTRQFMARSGEATSAKVSYGSISTQVSGSGTLVNVDEESITIPAGVTIDEITVSEHENVISGQLLAKINIASVMQAISSIQETIQSLDSDITDAGYDVIDKEIKAGVAGRIKQIYAKDGDDVIACMYEHGALALLSLDGYMAVEIDAGSLSAASSVRVQLADGSELDGTIDSIVNGKATVLVSDREAAVNESVTVLDGNGRAIGSGVLFVHSPLRISGISGKISGVRVSINQSVPVGQVLFNLTDTSYTARYQTLLKEREDEEDTLLELMQLYRDGGIYAPFSGSVSSVDYDEDSVSANEETPLLTLSPDKAMEVIVNVDESNILSLEVGQIATVTINSIGDEPYLGTVTEISRTANSSAGVTRYSATITLEKAKEMLQGMTARVVIRIQGVENAVIIPLAALQQTRTSYFVYTSYNEETHEFGGMKNVEVGITNSSNAEIIAGLSEGDTVWYTENTTNFFGNAGFRPGNYGNNNNNRNRNSDRNNYSGRPGGGVP